MCVSAKLRIRKASSSGPLFAILMFMLASVAQSHPLTPQQQAASADLQAMLEAVAECTAPGISAAVATHEGVIWRGTAGKANLDSGEPVRPDMLFGIGSITKTFVAVVILQLVEEGKLSLQDTAAGILGDAVQGVANADKATIAQLLNHTSGVPTWEFDPAWIRDGRGDRLDPARIWGKADTLPYIQGHPPTNAPGKKYLYSNTNYTLLGMVIEEVTGTDAAEEIRRRVLKPAGVKDIYLEGFESLPVGRLSRRYHRATEDFRRDAGVNADFPEVRASLVDASSSNLSVEWTAGGMVATARDLALYGVALRDGRLLKPDSMKFLQQWLPIGENSQVGHNLYRDVYQTEYGELVLIGHTGGVLGFGGWLHWVEGSDVVLAVMRNVGTMHSGSVPPDCRPARGIGRQDFAAAARRMADFTEAADLSEAEANGSVHVRGYVLPESSFLSETTRSVLRASRERAKEKGAERKSCPPMDGAERTQISMIRQCLADNFYQSSEYKELRRRYPVTVTSQTIAGVATEVFVPVGGVSPGNQERVLINVHGGSFLGGARTISHLESIPIASLGRIKIISVDYRQAPEYRFPSASEDVAAVYRDLLKKHGPQNIGIYGCSAGGLLTAQTVAWLQKEKLPRPGAVAMLCEGGGYWTEGDSAYFIRNRSQETLEKNPYFKDVAPNDPLAFPVRSPEVMAKFPPSLLITGLRDFAASSVVRTHALLVAQGVEADLHVWEGLGHAFHFDPALPESQEVYAVTIKFFDKHLAGN